MQLSESARELILSGAIAHMVTINPDGGPQVSNIWVDVDGDDLISGHFGEYRKITNIRRDPRVAFSTTRCQKAGRRGPRSARRFAGSPA